MKITLQQLERNLKSQYEKLFNSSSEKEVKEKSKTYHIENIIGGIAVTVFVNMIRTNQFINIPQSASIFEYVKYYKMTIEVTLCPNHNEVETVLINHFNSQTILPELIINGRKI